MKVLGLITARSGSKGVPDKNVKAIKNVPLLVFSAWCARESGALDEVLVSTDSPHYLELVTDIGIRTDYLRPKELSTDTSPTIDAVFHALDWYEAQGRTFDAVMILQPPAPYRTTAHIAQAIQLLEEHPGATCVTGIVELGDTHPARIKKLKDGKWLQDFCVEAPEPEPSRRQDFSPPAYLRNGTIYLTPVWVIRDRHQIRGDKVLGMVMPEANSVNVDTHLDFLIAEAALSYEPYRTDLAFFDALIESYAEK